ncbi:hypothetical protein [Xylophilus sp. GOD-11R]|uniref:type IV pilus modification PilV family protein n=1 Tax=Xylophilus sp. GOD-11R TaxID=3089814 RepID=UPI00298D1357|nr:hypothetical protein [Xylophilus sp. GOD-11R]WPB57648.1 hypothetical protein R9X41_03065 [Xylophilus sp. GOD-11R]
MIESICALLIFATGVLGIARLQSVAVQQTSTAAFRTTAAMLAKNLVATMWLSDRTPGVLAANFADTPPGSGYTAWLSTVTASSLPGVAAMPPKVELVPIPGGGTTPVASVQATVTIWWKTPGETAIHKYVETAQIK